MSPAIELRDAAADVGGRRVWSAVSLDVGPGELVCVLGPNGAGKSTLIKAMLGLVPLAAGRIRVLGQSPRAAGSDVGYLPQRRSFDAQLRIRGIDLVRLGLDGGRWGLPLPGARRLSSRARAAAARVDAVIELVGAGEYAQRPVGELSGGEQQRLLIAQALAPGPGVLLLDEPLDSLDLSHQSATAALVSSIARSEGMAVVLVAHDVNPIVSRLDRIVYLAGGTALTGSPAEVLTTERLSGLYRSPVEVLHARDGRLVVVGSPEAPARHLDRHAG